VSVETAAASMTDEAALPRSNGELVFDEPWHARAFGIAIGLVQEQGLDWEEFRARLIAEIGSWTETEGWSYYERWLAALERLAVELGMVSRTEIDTRAGQIAHELAHEH
jgi:nitrile hydratase accessory protein